MLTLFLRNCFVALVTLATLCNVAYAANEKVILVLDESGSMWGQIDGKAKITIAQEVIGGLLKDWKDGVELGVIAYGHRKKGDCQDIESIVPIGKVDAASINSKIKALQPKGKTPISASLQKAAEELKFTEEKATVILVSDGLETCNADPCAVAESLEKQGVDFKAHVVGFDLKEEEMMQLSCIADKTGGMLLSAKNAGELSDALGKVVEEVAEPEPKEPAKPVLKVNLKLTEDSDVITSGYTIWNVYAAEAKDNSKSLAFNNSTQAVFKDLKPGKYRINVRLNDTYHDEIVTLGEEPMEHIIILNAGYLRLKAALQAEGEPVDSDMRYWIYDIKTDLQGNRKNVAFGNNAVSNFTLPAGKYAVLAQHGNTKREEEIEVKAGEMVEHVMDLNVGYLKVTSTEYKDGPNSGAYFYIYEAKKDLNGKRKDLAFNNSNPATFKLPAGKVVAKANYDGWRLSPEQEVEIKPGELTEVTLNLGAGKIRLDVEGLEKGAGSNINIYEAKKDLEGNRKRVKWVSYAGEVVLLSPGKYVATATVKDKTYESDFSVKEGDEKAVTIED